jgi:RNA polymerase sigma factor (sigma-70 family)
VATDEAASRVPSPEEQSALAGRVAAGEAEAEEEFARFYRPRVLCLLRSRLRDWEAARELADDTLMAALQALRAGRVTHAERLSAFVAGTARNIANNFIRSRARQPRSEPLDVDMPGSDPVQELEETDRRTRVREEIARLDTIDRAVLELTLVDGLKPGEIAARLGLSSEVVRARKSRAVRKVIESVQERSRTPGPGPL